MVDVDVRIVSEPYSGESYEATFYSLTELGMEFLLENEHLFQLPEVYRQPNLPPTANRGGMVGVMTSGWSVQAALGSADACRLAGRSLRRSDFRQIAGMRADGPTPRKSRARPAWISPAVRVPGGRQGAVAARPGTRAAARVPWRRGPGRGPDRCRPASR
jgi:hypothetical protein